MNEKLKRIYTERRSVYKCEPEVFEREGLSIIIEEGLRATNRMTLAHTKHHTFIRLDPEIEEEMQWLRQVNGKPQDIINAVNNGLKTTKSYLKATYRYYYKLDDKIDELRAGQVDIIGEDKYNVVDEFFDCFNEDELEDADINLEEKDPIIFGLAIDDELVAYASHRYAGECIADIGVLVKTEYRKKGYAKAVVAEDVRWCINKGYIPQYVVLADNVGSVKVVENLGFEKIIEVYSKASL